MRIVKTLVCLSLSTFVCLPLQTKAQDSLNITLLGRGLPGECNATFVQDSFAYVGAGDVFMIYNIADPAQPFPVSSVPLPGEAGDVIEDLYVSNGYAYVAFDLAGLRVINVSSPLNPFEVGFLKFSGYVFGVSYSGNYAYVCEDSGLYIVDVSVPSSPKQVSFFPVEWAALNVFVQDTFAYLACGYGGLYILNVKNPANPVLVKWYDQQDLWVYEVKVVGNYLYMAFSGLVDGFEIFDITDRANPVGLGYLGTGSSARRIDVYGKFAYLAVADSGFIVIDIGDKFFPSVKGRWKGGYGQNVFFYSDKYGDKVCVSSEYEGLYLVDVSFADNPVKLSHYDTHSFTQDVTTSSDGKYAYVTEQPSGLKVLDISNPVLPNTIFDTLYFPGKTLYGGYGVSSEVRIDGNRLYVGNYDLFGGQNNLMIYDLSNPAHPAYLGKFRYDPGGVRGYVVKDTLAYLSTPNGVLSVSVANPASPYALGYLYVFGVWDFPYGVDIRGNYLYDASGTSGLRVINVSKPDSLWEQGSFVPSELCEDAMAVSICNNHAYLADYQAGLRIVDVTFPSSPFEVGYYNPYACTPQCMDVKVSSENDTCKYAYAAFTDRGVVALNVSSPYSPLPVGFYATQDPRRVHLRGDTLFVADRGRGLYILKVSGKTSVVEEPGSQIVPGAFSLFQNYPNPFNLRTEISYDLPKGDQVSLEIYNILGQKVRTLVNEYQTPGHKKASWDGTDDRGSGVASGIYFYQLRTGENRQVKKMVLLK